jgi:hypothetical protein
LDELLWDAEGGYLDYITDTRCIFYLRLYNGQATVLTKRIGHDLDMMASGDASSLHYYVKSIGGKYREANFLRAFRIPDSVTNQEDRKLLKNLLELEMCLALRTLPYQTLMQWLPPGSPEVKFPSVHLNIANPLDTGMFQSASGRQNSRNLLLGSVDPEVRRWPVVRAEQFKGKQDRNSTWTECYPPRAAYVSKFDDTIQANAHILGKVEPFDSELEVPFDKSFQLDDCLQNCEDKLSQYLGRAVTLVRPFGRLRNRIAIITSGASHGSSDAPIRSSNPTLQDQFVPYGLREMGLNADNTLIWPFNLRQSGKSRPDEMSTEVAATEAAYFEGVSSSLIAASSARFILICDGIEQRHVFERLQGLSPPIEITLCNHKAVLRIQVDKNLIQRVFAVIPDPKRLTRDGVWRSTQKFAQIVRLATILTKIEGINYNFFENNRSYGCILRAIAEEKTSGPRLTIQLLDPGLRQWLARKGFQTNDDIEELTKLVGSLADGLLVLLCCLPRQSGVNAVRVRKERVIKGPKYPKELLTAVRKLRLEKVNKYSNCPSLDEDGHDKVLSTARINISQKALGQPADGEGGQNGSGDEQEDDPDASNDELASMMEISLAATDDPQINIAEIPNYQPPREKNSERGRRASATWRAKAVHMLYNGDLQGILRKDTRYTKQNRYRVEFLLFRVLIPAWIDVDELRQATLKAELADSGSVQPVMKRLAMSNAASATAQRLAISVTVFKKNGSKVMFWGKRQSAMQAEVAHDLVPQLEAVQAELSDQVIT